MSKKKNDEKVDVKFLNSLVLGIVDIDGELQHMQFTIVQETESKKFRAYFDVVDTSKVKLQDELH